MEQEIKRCVDCNNQLLGERINLFQCEACSKKFDSTEIEKIFVLLIILGKNKNLFENTIDRNDFAKISNMLADQLEIPQPFEKV
jgi:hypothetical protein